MLGFESEVLRKLQETSWISPDLASAWLAVNHHLFHLGLYTNMALHISREKYETWARSCTDTACEYVLKGRKCYTEGPFFTTPLPSLRHPMDCELFFFPCLQIGPEVHATVDAATCYPDPCFRTKAFISQLPGTLAKDGSPLSPSQELPLPKGTGLFQGQVPSLRAA